MAEFRRWHTTTVFKCGQADHWARDCPKKNNTCTFCRAVGHIEHTCYDKDKGVPRGGKAAGSSARGGRCGTVGRGQGGQGRYVEVEEELAEDFGADHHMTGDKTLFEKLREVPPDFHVKQIKGKVPVKYWGKVRLSTDRGNGKRGELELREVLYMPGMSVNIFSL